MSKEICTVCGGQLRECHLTDFYSAAVGYMVPDNEKCPNAKKLMSCQDCGILYAKPKDDSDD